MFTLFVFKNEILFVHLVNCRSMIACIVDYLRSLVNTFLIYFPFPLFESLLSNAFFFVFFFFLFYSMPPIPAPWNLLATWTSTVTKNVIKQIKNMTHTDFLLIDCKVISSPKNFKRAYLK